MVQSVFKYILVICLAFGSLFALPVGNPSEASLYKYGICTGETKSDPCVVVFNYSDILRIKGGFYGDYVFNRHMEVYTSHDNISDIDQFSLMTNAGYIALNVFDWVDFFGVVGATKISITTPESSYSTGQSVMQLELTDELCWSAGTHITLGRYKCFAVGLEGQYFRTMPRLDSFISLASGGVTRFNNTPKIGYSEWQVGLGASYQWQVDCVLAVPYFAIARARSEALFNDQRFIADGVTYTLSNLKSKKMWGYSVGMSLVVSEMIGVTVEGRFADEKALFVNGKFRY